MYRHTAHAEPEAISRPEEAGGYGESDIVKAFTCVLLLTLRNFATFKRVCW